ncbi:plant phosphoribosyltransferase [Aureococcus anophagefferens]|nr:plant phosphoribosyltransferase [Aureococcus anophagefferens]
MQQDASSSGDCVFVRVVRGRGLSASRGLGASLGAAASSMARRSSGAAAREPTCRVLVRCGRLEAWTAPVEETAEPEWDSANLFMFPCDNVRSARQLVFEVFGGGMFDRSPAARRESRGSGSGDGFGASLSALLCAPGDDDDGPSRSGFCDDGADLVDDGPATLERRGGHDAARPRSVRYTECHTAVLRVETLDARGLESSLRGTARELWRRPYVELQLGSRVVAPSKGGGGSRGGDEDAWMTEDFSMLVTQPYAACPLRLRVMRPRLASDLGVVGDEILGEVEIPLALEPPGRHCGGGGDAADPGLRELRLAYNPGKGLAADVARDLARSGGASRRATSRRRLATFKLRKLRETMDVLGATRARAGGVVGAVGGDCDPYCVLRSAPEWASLEPRRRLEDTADGYAKFDFGGDVRLGVVDPNDQVVLAFYDAANNHAPLGKVKVRASGLATGHEYRKTRVAPRAAPLSYRRRRRRAAPQVSAALAIADPPIPRLVSEDVLRADARSWGGDVSEATHDWGSNISADLRKLKVAAMRLKDAGSVWAGYASELFEVYHWRPHGRTAPYAALGLVLIWHPSWIFTAFFAALFAALALNFPGRRKRQLDAIGVDRELSKGSFVAKGDARRDPDRPVHGDDDGDGDDDDDGGDDANFVAKLEHQYHDFVNMIMYTEHVFNEVSVVLEQGLAIFTWGDERISGVLALVFFLCVFVPVALVPPPLFYKVFFTFPYIVDPQGRQTAGRRELAARVVRERAGPDATTAGVVAARFDVSHS